MEKKTILWSEELKTGIEWQDHQHREFLKMTNDLFKTFYEQKGHIDIESTIIFLERHAKEHFRIEERYMLVFDYPEITQHINEHTEFKKFIDDIRSAASTSVLEAGRICYKLSNWFTEHVKIVDHAFEKQGPSARIPIEALIEKAQLAGV